MGSILFLSLLSSSLKWSCCSTVRRSGAFVFDLMPASSLAALFVGGQLFLLSLIACEDERYELVRCVLFSFFDCWGLVHFCFSPQIYGFFYVVSGVLCFIYS